MARKIFNDKSTPKGSVFRRSIVIGWVAGLFWGSLGIFLYYFNFSEVSPGAFLLRSWLSSSWTSTWIGEVVSIVIASIVSIFIAIIYYSILKKQFTMWVGVLYGAIIWIVVFYVLQPLFVNIPSISELSKETIVSTFCLFILYGTFIGYSISYDYYDTHLEERT